MAVSSGFLDLYLPLEFSQGHWDSPVEPSKDAETTMQGRRGSWCSCSLKNLKPVFLGTDCTLIKRTQMY
jgi:hypothetical protein